MDSTVAFDRDLERGRIAYAEHRWSDAFQAMTDADQVGGLPAEDLERLATVDILIGRVSEGIDTLTRAHERFLAEGIVASAARCAVWIGIELIEQGESARSAGWFARAQRLVQEDPDPGSVAGLLLVPQALHALRGGDAEHAAEKFTEAAMIGKRFRDPDLMALAQLGQGQAQIMLGNTKVGLGLFDEVMVAVTVGELSPIPAGIVYCAVIGTCQLAFDLGRALEWTTALDRWCAAQPDMVAFSGDCQVHRAELYGLRGAWDDALAAAKIAQERARRGDFVAVFGSWYQQGEVQRLRGDADAAEESYRQAGRSGFEPQPGLALLRLSQGNPQQAQSMIRRASDSANPTTRRRMLAARVEIELAAGDTAAARQAADELTAIAQTGVMPMLQAIAKHAEGAVLLGEGDFPGALSSLRRAWMLWQELDAPYEAARCRVLTARACRALDDEVAASMELDAARAVFVDLGARPGLVEVDTMSQAGSAVAAGPLTARELEVLRLVSAGKTNRVIAAELYLSEKTVARHMSNIFAKLGLSSRSAATAYAYEHALV